MISGKCHYLVDRMIEKSNLEIEYLTEDERELLEQIRKPTWIKQNHLNTQSGKNNKLPRNRGCW